ncbi:type 1 glutamine amidotransferase domain-containing protein [Flavobacterium succinicans]|uniref:Molecular chaperone Hsp31 and glyoxalase 3 n=1 Tax=Flavobacterium succinicans TaxID=29536 RepID=A0A199XQF3_9FLAO|nr:type 1 glutamine amidotransferase domain-containing protein [Flavobacterium succinicans]OAZ03486.1 molecular chaperone Hsp31 and glyoxalase 3 [Flavobacterium succinicans]
MKKTNLFAILLLTLSCFVATAQKQNKKMKKVLFVVTSHDQLGNTGEKTGFWTEEFAAPYYALADKGIQIDIATPLGGQPPIDPKSADPASATEDTKRFDADTALLAKLKNTKKLTEVNPSDYDAVFFPGGHGPLWDLAEDKTSAEIIATFYTQNKPVAFVCHAPAALKNVKINGDFLVKGKKVTGFTNSEEAAVGLTNVVPFLVEDMLQKNGGSYSKAGDWQSYAVEDGYLITGQNPASSKLVAEKLLAQLHSKK